MPPAPFDESWVSKRRFWVALGLIFTFLVALFIRWDDSKVSSRRSVARVASPSTPPVLEPAPAVSEQAPAALPDTEPASIAHGSNTDPEATCRPAPVRGCAPIKDERGCWHCARCSRSFHYDAGEGSASISMVCPEMQSGPFYVELRNHAPGLGPQRWNVVATFAGRESEQLVTTNLGAAFFADFQGGRVALTATLRECASPAGECRGDLEVTINGRR